MTDPVPTRLNLKLRKTSTRQMDAQAERHELTRTAAIERALALAEALDALDAEGGIYSKEADGTFVRYRFF